MRRDEVGSQRQGQAAERAVRESRRITVDDNADVSPIKEALRGRRFSSDEEVTG
jgi:hypothetical protein